jgi:hypothetical protein
VGDARQKLLNLLPADFGIEAIEGVHPPEGPVRLLQPGDRLFSAPKDFFGQSSDQGESDQAIRLVWPQATLLLSAGQSAEGEGQHAYEAFLGDLKVCRDRLERGEREPRPHPIDYGLIAQGTTLDDAPSAEGFDQSSCRDHRRAANLAESIAPIGTKSKTSPVRELLIQDCN